MSNETTEHMKLQILKGNDFLSYPLFYLKLKSGI